MSTFFVRFIFDVYCIAKCFGKPRRKMSISVFHPLGVDENECCLYKWELSRPISELNTIWLLFRKILIIFRHPEALRQCVKCVGIQRQLGKNVKQATDYCNRNDCPLSPKREILMNYLRELALEAEESYDKRK